MISSNDIDKNFFKKNINKKNPVIFDVGAFDGNDSLEFLKIFNNPKIYAFEADNRSTSFLKKYIKDTNINLIKLALSDVNGEIQFYQSESEIRRHDRYNNEKTWTSSSSIKKPDNHLNIFPDIQFKLNKTESVRLDTWILDKDIDFIDIMWVDVNGGESEFISGSYNTLVNKVKFLYIEFTAVDNKKLFYGSFSVNDIKNKLNNFEEIGIYNFTLLEVLVPNFSSRYEWISDYIF